MRRRRIRGLALADFLAGTMILTGTLLAYSELNRSKFELLSAADDRAWALTACEEALDEVRVRGVGPLKGKPNTEGFRRIRSFEPDLPQLYAAEVVVEGRTLRMKKGEPGALYEVRVTVTWKDARGQNELQLSTVARKAEERDE